MGRALLLCFPMIVAALSGCTNPPATTAPSREDQFIAAGDESRLSIGWAYDASTARSVQCVILINVSPRNNTGQVIFDLLAGEYAAQRWDFRFDSFSDGGQAHRSGGIVNDLWAHGDSGVDDASIPKTELMNAGWGEMAITLDGSRLNDPVTGQSTWLARYEVLKNGTRDDATGKIFNRARSAPYEPARPGDAWIQTGDLEVHATMKAHAPPPQDPVPLRVAQEALPTQPGRFTRELVDVKYFGSTINATLNLANTPSLAATTATVVVITPKGDRMPAVQVGPSTSAQASRSIEFTALEMGLYSVEVQHSGPGSFGVEGRLTPPKEVVMNLWWEKVAFDDEALDWYREKRHNH